MELKYWLVSYEKYNTDTHRHITQYNKHEETQEQENRNTLMEII